MSVCHRLGSKGGQAFSKFPRRDNVSPEKICVRYKNIFYNSPQPFTYFLNMVLQLIRWLFSRVSSIANSLILPVARDISIPQCRSRSLGQAGPLVPFHLPHPSPWSFWPPQTVASKVVPVDDDADPFQLNDLLARDFLGPPLGNFRGGCRAKDTPPPGERGSSPRFLRGEGHPTPEWEGLQLGS